MLSKQSIPPPQGTQSSFPSSVASRPVQLLRNTKDAVVSSKASRGPQRSVQASAQPGKGSSSPSPSRPQNRITNPAPATKARPFAQAPSAAETLTRGGALAANRFSPLTIGLPDDDPNDPLNTQIRELLSIHTEPDGQAGYLNVMRATLHSFASMAYDQELMVYTDSCDAHVKQLVRVLDELKKWGHCVLGGQIVRPG
ncbi:hypothetical protein GJ744_012151 [Endocarpon pusillum]|uniref:Uncharacterized protein n=1 Tax=Endocarpon pusillum TaxID=364733 RepID=A0A8H7E4B4_9EURO|nr:hypothetical protein GJ744_012151 [Endocarpon pusillum]